jgi:type I restriction enzyme, S subunit
MNRLIRDERLSFVLSDIVTRVRTVEENDSLHILTISSTQGWVDQRDRWARHMAGQSLKKYTKLNRGDFSYNKGNSKTFPYGCMFRLNKWREAVVPNVYHSFRISSNFVHSDYLQQYFWSGGLDVQLRRILTSGARDNGLLNITADAFFGLSVELPPLPEQQKIAAILTSVDDVIEKTQAQINKLQDLKKGTMNELLTRGIGHTEFKESPVGLIPVGWEVKKLGAVANIQGGYAFKSTDAVDSGVRWLKIANVGVGEVMWENRSFLPYNFKVEHCNYVLEEGDVVVALTRPVLSRKLKVAKVKASDSGALLNQRVGRIQCKCDVNLDFLYCVVQSKYFVDMIETIVFGSDPPNISGQQIESINIVIPSPKERNVIVKLLTSMDAKIKAKHAKLQHTQTLKKALMQDLLTGKTRVAV